MTEIHDHEPTKFYWEAGSEHCPHGSEPDSSTVAWDIWAARHTASVETDWVCLDAPMGDHCPACSAEHGDAVPWSRCENRKHARAFQPVEPRQHQPVTVDVAGLECLELECEDFFTEGGDEIPGKESCSHVRQMVICEGCSDAPRKGDEYPAVVAWADCQHVKTGAVQS